MFCDKVEKLVSFEKQYISSVIKQIVISTCIQNISNKVKNVRAKEKEILSIADVHLSHLPRDSPFSVTKPFFLCSVLCTSLSLHFMVSQVDHKCQN